MDKIYLKEKGRDRKEREKRDRERKKKEKLKRNIFRDKYTQLPKKIGMYLIIYNYLC